MLGSGDINLEGSAKCWFVKDRGDELVFKVWLLEGNIVCGGFVGDGFAGESFLVGGFVSETEVVLVDMKLGSSVASQRCKVAHDIQESFEVEAAVEEEVGLIELVDIVEEVVVDGTM